MSQMIPNRVTLVVGAAGHIRHRVGQWVETDEIIGEAPGPSGGCVRSPVTGVVIGLTPAGATTVAVVLERRREYEEMEH